jgi:CubicO group peptidase (beta-lactamase class C family)
MKPGEQPGKVFHYQTYGMNILTHALAKIYGLYTVSDPDGSPGLKQLVNQKMRIPIGASWSYYRMNFDLHSKARINIFGYYDGVKASALDMARLGWLWCNYGRWMGKQLGMVARSHSYCHGHSRQLSAGTMAVWLRFLDQRSRPNVA